MRFDTITLFPELFAPFMQSGINRRAFEAQADGSKLVDVGADQPARFCRRKLPPCRRPPLSEVGLDGHDGRALGPPRRGCSRRERNESEARHVRLYCFPLLVPR